MKIGYGLITCQRYPGDPREPTDLYQEAIALAKACEEAGLDSVWTSEHHFFDDDYMPSLLILSAAIAAVTERIQVGTGVLLAPLYHPVRLAEDTATLDLISGGRLILGLGLGWRPEEYERLGVPKQGFGRRLTETVQVLRKAWGAEPFEHEGKTYKIELTNVTPKPSRQIPIWIGGFVDAALRRAGRIGDAYLGSRVPIEDMARRKAVVEESLSAAGRAGSTFTFAVHEPLWISGGKREAIDEILPHVHYSTWKYRDMSGAFGRSSNGPLPSPPDPDDEARTAATNALIAGSVEEVAGQIKEFAEVLGSEMHFVARSYYPGVPFERSLEHIKSLGELKKLLG